MDERFILAASSVLVPPGLSGTEGARWPTSRLVQCDSLQLEPLKSIALLKLNRNDFDIRLTRLTLGLVKGHLKPYCIDLSLHREASEHHVWWEQSFAKVCALDASSSYMAFTKSFGQCWEKCWTSSGTQGQYPFEMHSAAQRLEDLSFGIRSPTLLDVSWWGPKKSNPSLAIFPWLSPLRSLPYHGSAVGRSAWPAAEGRCLDAVSNSTITPVHLVLNNYNWCVLISIETMVPRLQTKCELWGSGLQMALSGRGIGTVGAKQLCTRPLPDFGWRG